LLLSEWANVSHEQLMEHFFLLLGSYSKSW
jgi:hypothetical protein